MGYVQRDNNEKPYLFNVMEEEFYESVPSSTALARSIVSVMTIVKDAKFTGLDAFEQFVRDYNTASNKKAVKYYPNTLRLVNIVLKSAISFGKLTTIFDEDSNFLEQVWISRARLQLSPSECETVIYAMARTIIQYGKTSDLAFGVNHYWPDNYAHIGTNIVLYTINTYANTLTNISIGGMQNSTYGNKEDRNFYDAVLFSLTKLPRIHYLSIQRETLANYALAHPRYNFSKMNVDVLNVALDSMSLSSTMPLPLPPELTHICIVYLSVDEQITRLPVLLSNARFLQFITIIYGIRDDDETLGKGFFDYIKQAKQKICLIDSLSAQGTYSKVGLDYLTYNQ